MNRNVNPPEIIAEKCIRCGKCIAVCPAHVIGWTEEKACVMRGEWCIGCGHCGAVCPTEALLHEATSYDGESIQKEGPAVSPENLELLLRERRSVRVYRKDPIPREVLMRVIDAGRFGPTGTNSQNVRYVALTNPGRISELREMTLRFYEKVISQAGGKISGLFLMMAAGRRTVEYLRESLPKFKFAYEQMAKGEDPLFYHAPVLLLAHAESWDSSSSFNCSVALYHCSLLAHTLGIGCCFNGFLVNAVQHDRKIKTWLGVPRDHRCYAAMTLGYQDVTYPRLVRRSPAKVSWR
jgi:nitroreductase/NAD-dependent dihydropyrimidine dehydrogenase PreA subunit